MIKEDLTKAKLYLLYALRQAENEEKQKSAFVKKLEKLLGDLEILQSKVKS